jgi:hypothetical protein
MTARAVYAFHKLSITVIQSDLDLALTSGMITAPMIINGIVIPSAEVTIILDYTAAQTLHMVADTERANLKHAGSPHGPAGSSAPHKKGSTS